MDKKTNKVPASMPVTKTSSPDMGCGCGMMHHSHCHPRGRRIFSTFLIIILLIAGAVCLHRKWERFDHHMGYMSYGSGIPMASDMNFFMMKDCEDQVFGTITKIDGQNITVLNNGGTEDTFMSTSETMIMNSVRPVGFATLKVGDDVLIFGDDEDRGRDKDRDEDEDDEDDAIATEGPGVMEAKMIRVLESTEVIATVDAPVKP